MLLSNDKVLQRIPRKTNEQDSRRLAARAELKWGKTPETDEQPPELPDDHRIHKISRQEQKKMKQWGKVNQEESFGRNTALQLWARGWYNSIS